MESMMGQNARGDDRIKPGSVLGNGPGCSNQIFGRGLFQKTQSARSSCMRQS